MATKRWLPNGQCQKLGLGGEKWVVEREVPIGYPYAPEKIREGVHETEAAAHAQARVVATKSAGWLNRWFVHSVIEKKRGGSYTEFTASTHDGKPIGSTVKTYHVPVEIWVPCETPEENH